MASPSHTPVTTGFGDALVQRQLARALALPAQVPVFGISGLQSSDKSTLARQLVSAARKRGVKALAFSPMISTCIGVNAASCRAGRA